MDHLQFTYIIWNLLFQLLFISYYECYIFFILRLTNSTQWKVPVNLRNLKSTFTWSKFYFRTNLKRTTFKKIRWIRNPSVLLSFLNVAKRGRGLHYAQSSYFRVCLLPKVLECKFFPTHSIILTQQVNSRTKKSGR